MFCSDAELLTIRFDLKLCSDVSIITPTTRRIRGLEPREAHQVHIDSRDYSIQGGEFCIMWPKTLPYHDGGVVIYGGFFVSPTPIREHMGPCEQQQQQHD
jgi:hypothetical protein